MLAAEAGGTEIGQLTTGVGGGGVGGARLGADPNAPSSLGPFLSFVALAVCNSRCPLRMTLLSKEVASAENTDPGQNLAAWRPPPP